MLPQTRTARALVVLSIALLSACAQHAERSAPGDVLAPNANLVAQGIPPIPMSLVQRVNPYTDFRGHSFEQWHPTQREMLVLHRTAGASVGQLFRLAQPMGALEQLTNETEQISSASYEPKDGRYIVYSRSKGGDEALQLYRLDLPSKQVTQLTDAQEAHRMAGWLRPTSEVLVASVPLDRTAQGGTRASFDTALSIMDPTQPSAWIQRRKVAELPGGGWFAGGISPDGQQAAFTQYRSANESSIWLINLGTGERRQVLPKQGDNPKAAYFPAGFSPDGKRLFFVSDHASEFREAMVLELASGQVKRITGHIPWDASGGSMSEDGRWAAVQINNDGKEELRLFDGATLAERAAPALPAGSIGGMAFHRAGHGLAYSLNSALGPSTLYVLDPASGKTEQWTQPAAPATLDVRSFSEQRIVRWKSFDGLTISGLYTPAPKRFAGKRPVIVLIHGGPEAQAQMGFMGRWQYFVQERGVALLQPNVRGSSGYGKTFLTLDNGIKREDSVKDIGALLDWIAQQPELDASRVLITGGSYGGYMTLAAAVHYSDRIVGGIPVVGPSNFVTFLTNTESYRRDLRRVEYGDERDPAMRAYLEKIAPANNVDKIKKPLFVVQGKNDPRVPYTESEQIVARLRERGLPVWYLRAENEGHGFARKENADFQFFATVKFVEETLLR
jgi:dipeptidyl aminopeptidase/acylaminoacyl peptidase